MGKRKKHKAHTATAKKNLRASLRISRQKKQRWKGWDRRHATPKESGLGWVYFVDIGQGWVKLGHTRQDVDKYLEGKYFKYNPMAKLISAVQSSHARTAEGIIRHSLRKLKVKKRTGTYEVYKLSSGQVEAIRTVVKETMWINRDDIESWPEVSMVVGLLRGKHKWKGASVEKQKTANKRQKLAQELMRQEEEIALSYIEAIK